MLRCTVPQVYKWTEESVAAGRPVAGSLMWMLADVDYPDYDGFTVYDKLKGETGSDQIYAARLPSAEPNLQPYVSVCASLPVSAETTLKARIMK